MTLTSPPNWRAEPVGWAVSDSYVDYEDAVAFMEKRAAEIHSGDAAELIWLLEHPPLLTGGTSAKPEDLHDPERFPVHKTTRGGQYTYHGPGQRVAYVMLDLSKRKRDVRRFVCDLESWIINALDQFQLKGERRVGRVGVWIDRARLGGAAGREDKIAAIGVRVRRWVTFHGVSLNVDPNLEHYSGLTPCGISEPNYGVTSLTDLGLPVGLAEADDALKAAFEPIFGPVRNVPPPVV